MNAVHNGLLLYNDRDKNVVITTGSLTFVNSEIYITESSSVEFRLYSGFYSYYNVTIFCENDVSINYTCNSTDPQFIKFDSSCTYTNITFDDTCNFYDSTDHMDNTSIAIIDELWYFINTIDITNNTNTNDDYVSCTRTSSYDIGYPFYVDESVSNNAEFGNICCRGYQSCAITESIQTNYGNILCLGYQSCMASNLIWTDNSNRGNDISTNNAYAYETNLNANIYCLAISACGDSILESPNNIICGSDYSCKNSVILGGNKLYCTNNACQNTIVRNVNYVYFIDSQTSAVVYSGGTIKTEDGRFGVSQLYFRGRHSADDVTYYCNDGDVCYIHCDETFGCNNKTTLLYCSGKCFVSGCDEDVDSPRQCPEIVTSLSPSAAPSSAPSDTPSVPPSNAPTESPSVAPSGSPTIPPTDLPTKNPTDKPTTNELLTDGDIYVYFNWVLGVIIGVSVLLIVIGISDAWYARKNELFEWSSILMFAFYTNDFMSDIFFSLKLYFLASDNDNNDNNDLYRILFIGCVSFIVVPLIFNIIQLHFEINKWTKDEILKSTSVSQWINTNLKFLYFIAIICGSSFSAIALCNSYLFQMPIFGMGLSYYHRNIFQNKRFWSIVLLEVKYNTTQQN